jgi:hypothetical protein
MEYAGSDDDGQPSFRAKLASDQSGHFGLTVRVFPRHASLPHKHALFTMRWR